MRSAHPVAQVRAAEAALMARLPTGTLMQRAAAGLAHRVAQQLGARHGGVYGGRVALLVGRGNNGAAASWSVPTPGPITQACTRPAPSTATGSATLPPAPAGTTVTTHSGQRWRTSSAADGTEAKRTIPAPARSAPPTASTAAPG